MDGIKGSEQDFTQRILVPRISDHSNKYIHLESVPGVYALLLAVLSAKHQSLPSAEPSGKLKSPTSRSL